MKADKQRPMSHESRASRIMPAANWTYASQPQVVLGFTFKENCPDLRNTRVIDLVHELQGFSTQVDVYDPWADLAEAKHEYGISLLPELPAPGQYDALVVAVGHDRFKALGIDGLRRLANGRAVIYDIKGMFGKDDVDGRLWA